jgi:putative peptidoglycan lipid II flippase
LTEKHHKLQILKSASIITLVTVASRILGYVRDQRITLLLGTALPADSFVLAFRIPNLLRRLVGEGSMTASFIPVFTSYMAEKSREEVWEFAHRLFWTLAVLMAGVTVLGIVFSSTLIQVFTLFGAKQGHWELAVHLNRIIFPYIFFISLAALSMAILNCFQIFGLPAATPILLNASLITFSVAAVWRHFANPAEALAVGILVGGALQFLVQVPLLVRRGMRFHFGVSFQHPGVRSVARLMVPGFFGIGIYQVNFFVDTIFATAEKMPQGSVTSLYVADRVMELVLGGYAIAVATAILPLMSQQAAVRDIEGMKKMFAFALRIVSFITIPATVGLMVLREPIIQVLFEHGRFVAESTRLTARALLYYALGLPAFAGIKLIVPAFYSTQDTRTPVRVAGYALVLNIILNTVFLKSFFQTFSNGGPALATSLCAYFNFFLLFAIFRRRFGALESWEILTSLLRIAVSATLMGFLCYAMLWGWREAALQHLASEISVFALMVAAATAAFLALAWLLRCHELEEVYGIATRKEQVAGAAMTE